MRNYNFSVLSPCQSALKGTHGRGSKMNQSWGRDVWGSGTVVMTHSRRVSERRTEAGCFSATMTTDEVPSAGQVFYRGGGRDFSALIIGDAPLYEFSSSSTSHYHNTTSFLSAFKAVFVNGASAQARALNCSLCVYAYLRILCQIYKAI